MVLFDLNTNMSCTLLQSIIPEQNIDHFFLGDYAYSLEKVRLYGYIKPSSSFEISDFKNKINKNTEGFRSLQNSLENIIS